MIAKHTQYIQSIYIYIYISWINIDMFSNSKTKNCSSPVIFVPLFLRSS